MTTQETERKQQEKQGSPSAKKTTKKKSKRNRTRGEKLLAFIAKWIFISFCLLFSVIFGLVVGYSIIGEGSIGDVFDIGTWKHLYDLVFTS